MSSPRRRLLLSLAALAAASACGFSPVYGPGGAGAALEGRIAVSAPDTVEGHYLALALEERLGRAGTPLYALDVVLDLSTRPAALAADGTLLRQALSGEAGWRLSGPEGEIAAGTVNSYTAWSTGGSTIATRTAEAAARERLGRQLADLIVARLLALPPPE